MIIKLKKLKNLQFKLKFMWYPKVIEISRLLAHKSNDLKAPGTYLVWFRNIGILENSKYPDPDNIGEWDKKNQFFYVMPASYSSWKEVDIAINKYGLN